MINLNTHCFKCWTQVTIKGGEAKCIPAVLKYTFFQAPEQLLNQKLHKPSGMMSHNGNFWLFN